MYALAKHLPDARDGYTGESFFILYYKGKKIEVVLNAVSTNKTTNPIQKVWRVLCMRGRDMQGLNRGKVIKVLKEAPSSRGLNGWTDDAFKEVDIKKPNVQVELIEEEK